MYTITYEIPMLLFALKLGNLTYKNQFDAFPSVLCLALSSVNFSHSRDSHIFGFAMEFHGCTSPEAQIENTVTLTKATPHTIQKTILHCSIVDWKLSWKLSWATKFSGECRYIFRYSYVRYYHPNQYRKNECNNCTKSIYNWKNRSSVVGC